MKTDITVITHTIKYGQNEAFESWLHGIIQEAIQFKGYQGINVIKPFDNTNEYTLTVRFDARKNRLAWEASEIRKEWVSKLDPMISKEGTIRYEEGVEFWFSVPKKPTSVSAPKWKMALLTWCAAFCMIFCLSTILNIVAPELPFIFRLLILTMIMILSLTYVIMPQLTKIFYFWLFKQER